MLDYLRVSCYNKKMAATSDIGVLLRFYAKKQNSPFVSYQDFVEYLKHYTQHNIDETPDLALYLGNPIPQMEKAFEPFIESKQIVIIDSNSAKKMIFVTGYFNTIFAERYKEIQSNPNVPFPTIQDLPKQTPQDVLVKTEYADIIFELLKSQKSDDKNLYAIVVPNNLPSIIFPGNVPVSILVNASLEKMQLMLAKPEYHDYYLKKLKVANPNKEISVKNFFKQLVKSPEDALMSLKSSSDCYYLWGQLCHFIRLDYEKVKDFTQEDINVLQAVAISEIVASFYKNESTKTMQQELAIKSVQSKMKQPPFFFTMDGILKFTDAKGVPLQGQYSDEALKEFLQKETTDANKNELPNMLVFKTEDGTKYFIYKEKVFPLVNRMCGEAHDTIAQILKDEWYELLLDFEKTLEMTDDRAFNLRLEKEVQKNSPVLHAILGATFLSVLNSEIIGNPQGPHYATLFSGDDLLPYTTLLLLNRQNVLSDAKILLPFWYTIPIFSWIASLFKKKASAKKVQESVEKSAHEESEEKKKTRSKTVSKKDSLIAAAEKLESNIVPEGSTIERELNAYRKLWNIMISKEASLDLTNNVNSLIRDYTRKVLKTLNSRTLTIDRIQNLANTLCKTPNMQKINDQNSLYVYVQLYMIYLMKNM